VAGVRSSGGVAYLGPEGTFSHLLARSRFPKPATLVPKPSLDAVFDALRGGETACALVPVENSSGGVIPDTIDLLIESAGEIQVCEELALDVRPALIGKRDREIRTIYSHFAPLRHFRHWLRESFPDVEIAPVSSTAQAARDAQSDPSGAAISAPGAAELYGLDVLRFPLLPGGVNITHFYVLKATGSRVGAGKAFKTALVAMPKTDQCGILHKLLGPFARGGINLKRIVSRPVPGRPETYVFFIEIDGAAGESAIDLALARAGRFCEKLTVLGSYPSGKQFRS